MNAEGIGYCLGWWFSLSFNCSANILLVSYERSEILSEAIKTIIYPATGSRAHHFLCPFSTACKKKQSSVSFLPLTNNLCSRPQFHGALLGIERLQWQDIWCFGGSIPTYVCVFRSLHLLLKPARKQLLTASRAWSHVGRSNNSRRNAPQLC